MVFAVLFRSAESDWEALIGNMHLLTSPMPGVSDHIAIYDLVDSLSHHAMLCEPACTT